MAADKSVPEAPVKDVEAQKDAAVKQETEGSGSNLAMLIILGVVGLIVIFLICAMLWFKFQRAQCRIFNDEQCDDAWTEGVFVRNAQCLKKACRREFQTWWGKNFWLWLVRSKK